MHFFWTPVGVKGQCIFHVRAREERAFCTCFVFLALLLGLFWLGSRENSLNSSRLEKFCSFHLKMLYAFDLNLKWLPDTVVKEVNEKVEMLVQQDVPSVIAYQRIVLNLAAGNLNPGRLLIIQFFFRLGEGTSSEKKLRDVF